MAPSVLGTEDVEEAPDEQEEVQQESNARVMSAKFAFMGRTFQVRGSLEQLRGLKAFVNDKISEIQAYMTDNGIENQEVSDHE